MYTILSVIDYTILYAWVGGVAFLCVLFVGGMAASVWSWVVATRPPSEREVMYDIRQNAAVHLYEDRGAQFRRSRNSIDK